MQNSKNTSKIKKLPSWDEVWKYPFKTDDYGYVYDKNNEFVFTVDDLTEENDKFMNDFCHNLVNLLNGKEYNKYKNLSIKDGCDLYMNNELIGYFRGWGHLCGTGGLNLSHKQAAQIQDELINYVMNKLKYE